MAAVPGAQGRALKWRQGSALGCYPGPGGARPRGPRGRGLRGGNRLPLVKKGAPGFLMGLSSCGV